MEETQLNKIFKQRFDSMPNEEAKRLVKKLNQRIVEIGKNFGKDSEVYNNMVGVLQNKKYMNFLGESQRGYLKIQQSNLRANMQNEDFRNLLLSAERAVPTITKLKERTRERLEQEGRKVSDSDIFDEIVQHARYKDDVAEVLQFIYQTYEDDEARREFPEFFDDDRVPTYGELDQIIKRINEEKKEARTKKKEEKGLM